MSKPDIETPPPVFFDLLAHFCSSGASATDPISNPDKSVNRMMEKRESSLRKASVLIPITRHRPDHESRIVLTVRSESLNSHAGQISLPGGSVEDGDVDAAATALRESEEEIGLPRDKVEVIGQLGKMALPSGFQITPVIGIIEPGLEFVPCPNEVAEIFQAPLSLVLDQAAYTASSMTYDRQSRKILELQYEKFRIWGATAAILYHLAQQIADSKTRK